MRTVIFDLDGTSPDTSADLIAAANACFREMGHGRPARSGRGCPDRLPRRGARCCGWVFRGWARDRARPTVDRWYPALLCRLRGGDRPRDDVLYPGAVEAVEALRAGRFAVTGICTNKPARLAEILLTAAGVRGLFGSLVGADTLPVRKPDPAPYRALGRTRGRRRLGTVDPDRRHRDRPQDRGGRRRSGGPRHLRARGAGGARLEPEALLDAGSIDLPAAGRTLVAGGMMEPL
jgi:phosphoglycolate phosphatase